MYQTHRKVKIRYNIDGNSGVGQAIQKVRNNITFDLIIRTGYNRVVDYGLISYSFGNLIPSHSPIKTLLMSDCVVILYSSNLPDRLLDVYKQARKSRKSIWLVDLDIQKPEELAISFNQSYIHHYWSNNVTIIGSTDIEDPTIHEKTISYFSNLLRLINAN